MDPLLDKISVFYSDTIKEYGPEPKGVSWNTCDRQGTSFKYLAKLVADETAPLSVADLGCGYGALYNYLKCHHPPVVEYIGYDVSPAMLEVAREAIGVDTEVTLCLGSELDREVDWGFASGTFHVTLGQDANAWERMVLSALDNIHRYTRKGFAFNMMTDRVDWKAENIFYANPGRFLNYCTEKLSRRVRLYHDMSLFQWTMLVYKS